jgi:thiol-disulfide isomerase/thioredoxin
LATLAVVAGCESAGVPPVVQADSDETAAVGSSEVAQGSGSGGAGSAAETVGTEEDPAASGVTGDPSRGSSQSSQGGSETGGKPADPADTADPSAPSDGKPAAPAEGQDDPVEVVAQDDDFPYAHRFPMPDFPKDSKWLNTSGPLRKQDLKGKFVLLDFWTYCCINCMHILPELKKLERAYPNELVVIGVHSAKFDNEKDSKNIEEAILRYEIEHPVVNDSEHEIWNMLGVSSWPTVLLIDPQGNAIWGRPGEIKFEDVDAIIKAGLPWYRKNKLLDATPVRMNVLAERQRPTPLRFPGKVLADEPGDRLYITDSNHNRIVVTTLDGKLLETIGSGAIGRKDGGYAEASFDHPQGLALLGETLYVADTENHMLRKVDLAAKQITTLAGIGQQARSAWPGLDELGPGSELPDRWVGKPKTTALNSPWALWVHGQDLYIAMAGPHQIWKMPLDESEIGPYAGNGREDIVDGPLLPAQPYELGYSSFAQPSGLTSDGTWLYVADSEGSSIRAVPFDPAEKVRTVVGTSELPYGRLFEFGDVDGEKENVRLQHALGVTWHEGLIYVADTYNNKIKVVDAETGATRTLAGTGQPGLADEPGQFDEPAGVAIAKGLLYVADTNNHRIRTVDIQSGKVATLAIEGLESPLAGQEAKKPSFAGAAQVAVQPATVKAADGKIVLDVKISLPDGYKISPDAPMSYYLDAQGDSGAVDRQAMGRKAIAEPVAAFQVPLPVAGSGQDTVKLSMNYFYCQSGGEGLCKLGAVVFTVPLTIADDAPGSVVELRHKAE